MLHNGHVSMMFLTRCPFGDFLWQFGCNAWWCRVVTVSCQPPCSTCVESCRVMSCRFVSCRVVSCRVVSRQCHVVSCPPPCPTWWCISFGLRIDLPLIQTIFAPFLPPRKLASASFPPWRRNQSGWPVPRRRSLPFLRWFGMISFRPPFYSVFFFSLKTQKSLDKEFAFKSQSKIKVWLENFYLIRFKVELWGALRG